MMNYRTVAQLNACIINNIYKIPRDIDIVIGIPRSGMLVASLIALYMNKPMSDIDSFVDKKIYSIGNTKNKDGIILDISKIKKALIVDDSVGSGKAILKAKDKLKNNKTELLYLAPYVERASAKYVDIYFEIIDQPRVFEWNIMHHKYLENACVDIDGVLCHDPSPYENDDGENYIEFLANAKTKYIPTIKIGYLVTSRLEKYRPQTEEWLKKNNIRYDELIMMDINTAEERRRLDNHGTFKGNVYKKIKKSQLFIESEEKQADEIHKISSKDVICIDSLGSCKSKPTIKKTSKAMLKKVIGENNYQKVRKVFKKAKNENK